MFIKVGKIGEIGSVMNSGGGSLNTLPAKFQQVEFIGSSGIEFFHIDPFDYNGSVIEFKTRYKVLNVDKNAFGAISIDNNSRLENGIGWINEGVSYYSANYGACGIRLNYLANTLAHIWQYDFSGVNLDGVKVQSYEVYFGNRASWGIFKEPLSLRFFGTDRHFTNRISDVEFYYWKCIKDGIVKILLIPCYNKITNIVGMYDVVNKKFYVNEGKGTFVKGADI